MSTPSQPPSQPRPADRRGCSGLGHAGGQRHTAAAAARGRQHAAGLSGPRRALDARTLYLAGDTPLRLSSTGEALVIARGDGMPAQRLPIDRVLRIVCSNPRVDWSGAALALCLQHGVLVSWLSAQGRAQGQLWPARSTRMALAELLEVLCADDPGWPESWHNWLRHQRQALVRDWCRQREQAGQPVGEAEVQLAMRRVVYRNETPQLLPEVMQGLATALVAQRLNDAGLAPRLACWGGETVELLHELARLIWIEMNLCAGPLAGAIERPREAAALFEHCAGTCAGAVHAHLAHLHGHALRRLEELATPA
ncbi:MAG: hypothetical protein RLZZ584_4154 [Pseudomonadota bacterium]|jgi:hypothetical protein